VYFSEVDHVGHEHGPDSDEVLAAATHLDQALGEIIAGVRALNLFDRTALVIVSDHGMSQLSEQRLVFLDDYVDLASIDVIDWSPAVGLAPRGVSVDRVYNALAGKHPAMTVYKREQTPAMFHYRNNPRIPPIICLARDGWTITSHRRLEADRAAGRADRGNHGYDPRYRSMHGLFVAAGPGLRRGLVVPAFENIHIYDFLCELLGLTPAPNDGDLQATRQFLSH